ncbi:MAG TPA: serine/threonine-protein kinase [Kofleriaceae bacterium]|jgi:serine/threonine protein kinase/tetratricopeptide (TPR) repeat protein|nr:serine/threonine-protein kinase [Kofleriaceae bacterium]
MVDRTDEAGGDRADELRDVRPRVDRLDMEQARARAAQALFGSAAPAKLGRYVLLGKSGDGGMGVVYAAYDPELHRKVALKILHPRQQHERAHERLIAEARALAKLDHPNVVKVHDVITHGDQVVLVMEWVEGDTLATWGRSGPRPWRDVLQVYLQAAHGLAAAHGVGVVHRDFKPANAILGTDGRVRVLDFGLARPADTASATAQPSATPQGLAAGSVGETWPMGLTATGAMVGTLAYAPPEQLQGAPATPASDQFSFAVSLHHALEGVSPFAGDDISSRLAAIQSGHIALATDGRVVPAWLRAIIARALASPPAARFPSLRDLIAALTRPRGWRRWRNPAALGALTAIAVVAILTRHGANPLADCDGGVSDIDQVWSPAARAQISVAFDALHAPWVMETRERVLQDLDAYRARWIDRHRDACVAHRRGAQSESLLDRRMLCMQRRLVDLQSAVSVLSRLDSRSATNAIAVVSHLPTLEECADVERLQSQSPPPPASAQHDVARVRTSLSQAAALDRIGRNAEAIALATRAAADAEQIGYPPLIADASMVRGRVRLAARNMKPATTAFARALEVALTHHVFAVAVEAGARKIYTEGMLNGDLAAMQRDAAYLLPLSLELPGDHFARPLLLTNIGGVYMAANDRAHALRYYQDAHDALAGVRDIDPELTCVDENLARLTPDPAAREALVGSAWVRKRAAFGDANLATLEALSLYARLTDDPTRALPLLTQACEGFTTWHPELVEQRAYCESYRAFLTEQLGNRDEALRIYDGIIALGKESSAEDVLAPATLAAGSAALLRGDLQGAALAWRKIAEADAQSPRWWIRVRAAHAELGLGVVFHLLHQDAEAAAHFERATRTYSDIAMLNEEAEYRVRLALAQQRTSLPTWAPAK